MNTFIRPRANIDMLCNLKRTDCVVRTQTEKLIPVCRRHVLKWPLTTKLSLGKISGPCSAAKSRWRRQKPIRILLPVWFRHL